MAQIRSVEFLPEIFQTDANRQFLAATLDQLIQEPKFKKTQGYIGRTVGPGVNPNDRYVIEPNKTRADYQLEPGVIAVDPVDNSKIVDAITYPGMTDALIYQGANTSKPDQLYTSDYYSIDPFLDFDPFVNFNQYYWLPNGPDVVSVQSPGVPLSQNFTVNRADGVYTFSGIAGENPVLNLVREGNYTFQVAQNNKETVNFKVTRTNVSSYNIDNQPNETLTLIRGNTYVFNLFVQGDFPFWIKTSPTTGIGDAYNSGVSRNGATVGEIIFVVPQNAPDTLYYSCENQVLMRGTINIIDSQPGTGPGFWIQTNPGIDGLNPVTPNISSRSVYGVTNNGLDLGLINFNVPKKTAQDFFYNLNSIGFVDLVTGLNFDQINGARLDQFIETYGGIDGITDLDTRTLVFNNFTGDVNSNYYSVWRISYVEIGAFTYLSLVSILIINNLNKMTIRYGTQYSSTQWYKNQQGYIVEMPVLTAKLDTLYYQDGTDPEIFGTIRLIDQADSSTIFIQDIVGKPNYTSPNGVVFTNGLKVQFLGQVSPASFATGSRGYVCTNTSSGINLITTESTLGMAVGQEIVFTGSAFGGVTAGVTYYVQAVFSSSQFKVSVTKNGPPLTLTSANGNMTGVASQNPQFYVSGVGTAIKLLPVSNYITPELYAADDLPDYLTINRDSPNLNAWSRSNRWFHIDVLNATSDYNQTPLVLDNNSKGKRPILQFRGGLRLYNMGTDSKQPVNVIDFDQTDAFSNVEGSTGYSVNNYTLVNGSRIIFASDEDPDVRNKIYVVNFVTPDTQPPLISQPIINLVPAADGQVTLDQCTVVVGGSQIGLTYWYNGDQWIPAQQKTSVQQAPLFDIYDENGFSLGNSAVYPSSTFVGSKLFSYAQGTGPVDPVLQFQLKYLTLTNVGDIVFDNNLYADSFVFVRDNVSTIQAISTGFVREYASRTEFQRLLGWQTAVTPTLIRQQFKFIYAGVPLKLDVAALPSSVTIVPSVRVFVGSIFQDPGTYTVDVTSNASTITFTQTHIPGDVVTVEVLSDQISPVAFYQVPANLNNNPLNANSPSFTLGTLRTHYETICQNLTQFSGKINGANNSRDLGNILPYGQIILQQSAPLTMTGYFLRSQQYNIFAALEYNSREYQKYKNQMLEAVTRQTIQYETAAQVLDLVITEITLGKTESNPFYWSDMLPSSAVFISNSYTVSYTTSAVFDTVQVYNYTSANYKGMNVYLNDEILTRDLDYVVATDGPRIEITADLAIGDVVTIQEYTSTYGTYVPNTPSKMGLYPTWRPQIVQVKTTRGQQFVIIGHDGSQTPLFGDIRDQVLLEFETRIYNNIKLDGNPVPLTVTDVLPGQFRETGYSYNEISSIFESSFLTYVGWNKLNYTSQNYLAANEFSYNYSSSTNKLNNENLLGAWRGINRYFYDTQQPQLTPWEMLGFTVKPDWWEITYGPAPYSSDNLNLWDDLELGLVRDPLGDYILPAYARPRLLEVLPTDSTGSLVSPLNSVVGDYSYNTFQKSWVAGDGGPTEASWWNSSDYPFAVMRLLALTRPAKFFALFADRDLYRYSTEFDQYLYNNRYRLDANGVQVYGNGTSKASYVNWIVDYNRVTGINSTDALTDALQNLDVRLCYRMASFSDKQYLKIYTEKSSPNSTNSTLQIPPESFQLLIYKNQPFDRLIYSSVVIQVVENGWAVFGYSTTRPYFNILTSVPVGQFETYSVAGKTIQVPANYSQNVTQVPYGFVFTTESAVANFLLSYGKLLEQQGFVFDNQTNGYVMSWSQMVYEFLYWSQQGWGVSSLINLNPLADGLSVYKEQAVVDNIKSQTAEHLLLDQNRKDFPVRDLNIVRVNNKFSIQPLTNQSLSYVDIRYTNYESMIVLDNTSLFGDLIYNPTTGARQSRLFFSGSTTTEWDGSVNAQGFILNQNNIETWDGLRTYAKGEIVKYKGAYWSAATIVQPSTKFNYNDWNQSDYTFIEQGLLANLSNKADQLTNSYNINSANLVTDNDLLSYGLIGFRPRQYMAALNLDDVSQVNIYREFLDTKGTKNSIDLFGQAKFNKEVADYQVFENWAIQRGVYGANANRSYIDLRLNRALLNSNPSLVQIIEPSQASTADQTVLLSNVWKSSFPLTTTNIFPTTTELPTDIALPTAGYVNFDDADITVFDLNDPASLSANINSIIVGTTIWVAKVNNYDWDVYRAEAVPGTIKHVCDNLNGTCRIIFDKQHGLTVGDRLIVRFFDAEINGVYRVLSVPGLDTVNVALSLEGDRTVVDGTGIGFTLKTMRVPQASDVLDLPYAKQILPGAKVWVDNDGQDNWEVLQKQNPFNDKTVLTPAVLDASEQYGAAVAQATDRSALFIGSPQYGFGSGTARGGIYLYVKSDAATYQPISPISGQDTVLNLTTTGVRNLGTALDVGSQTFGVAGAPASLGPAPAGSPVNNGYATVIWRDPSAGAINTSPWSFMQLLTLPGTTTLTTPGAGEFGAAVAMSLDERWLYVGAPGFNTVYAYGQVQWQNQYVQYRADGVSTTADIGDAIQINNANQIVVTKNNAVLTLTTDYTVSAGFDTVTFTTAPADGDVIYIARNNYKSFIATGAAAYSLSPYLFNATNIYSFSVVVDTVQQRPNIDYTFAGGTLTFYNVPTVGAAIGVTSQFYYQLAGTITPSPAVVAGARFGSSVQCSTDGRQVIIGCSNATVSGATEAGSVYVFDRNVQKFIRQDDSSNTYTVLGTVTEPVSVIVNNTFLLNQTAGIVGADNTFSVSGNNVTINKTLAVGDVIEIEINQFVQQQIVTQDTVAEFTNYGYSLDLCPYNCSLYVGAPQDSSVVWKGGVVERSVNQARTYGTITATVANPSLTAGQTLRVNNMDIAVPAAPNNTVAGLAAAINGGEAGTNTGAPNATASVSSDGYLTISVLNTDAAPVGNKLQVAPGSTGSVFSDLSFETFVFTQTIASPIPVEFAQFGYSLAINDTALNLVVGSPKGSLYLPMVFDYNTTTQLADTTFDGNSTSFFSPVTQSGAVYTYDFLSSANESVANPGAFVFGQQVETNQVSYQDQFGYAVSYNSGVLVATAPGEDFGDSSLSNYGAAYLFENNSRRLAWEPIRVQKPVVDIRLLTSVYTYDSITSAKSQFFDFFDPLQGKVLGAAQSNIDYISAVDPAAYNVGSVNNRGNTWNATYQGQIWWNIGTVRFIDPNQDDPTYASRRWGQVFPGSRVEVYQWIVSTVPPANYTGPGIPYNTTSYVVSTRLNQTGTFSTEYYFWVRGITETALQQGKTLSVATIASYIQEPKSSGISYIAPINSSTIAIYNGLNYIEAADTIISVEFDQSLTDANVHTEYELIAQGQPDAFLSDNLYRKLQDSFCGVDTFGNIVPDRNLSPAQRYGVQFRPRQSMFVDRFAALKNYIQRANAVFSRYPITEIRSFALLNSADPEPTAASGEWNLRIPDLETLSFQNIYAVPLGYRYLVVSNSLNRGLWTINQVQTVPGSPGQRQLVLARVQNFNTRSYWSYVNWYQPGYNASSTIVAEVANYSALVTLTVPVGTSVKVTANAQGKFEIYTRTETGWDRVGLQDGTIEISAEIYDYALGRFGFDVEVFDAQYYDQEPVIETRKILQAINQELLIDDLLIERNQSLILMFNFILSELLAPEWLIKTSLIDVQHKVRDLLPYQNYIRDNQEFVSDYIQEVKPYHVQIREFNLTYDGRSDYFGDLTDFDLPAYYNTSLALPQYVSPILTPYRLSSVQQDNTLSNTAPNSVLWTQWPYSQWFENYLLHVESITVTDPGVDYTIVPNVIIVAAPGDSGSGATATATINSQGQISGITVTDPGLGYRVTPTVIFDGGNGSGAAAYPVMNNGVVRNFRTIIKYDRYQYQTSILTWSSDGTYENGTLVRYDNRVWQATSEDGSSAVVGPEFLLENWTPVDAATLSGVNRTMGFYVPGVNELGLDLTLLVDGVSYPGVQVWGDYFLGSAPVSPTLVCTETHASTNQITCVETTTLAVNSPIRFFGTVIGGIQAGTVYYVNAIVDANNFTISLAPDGLPVSLTSATGTMIADIPEPIDAIYASSFTDQYLGLRPSDINVDGGEFVGPYEGHAPEELINGAEYDTMDFRVYTRPGADWTGRGHGFAINSFNFIYDETTNPVLYWGHLVQSPVNIEVSNLSTNLDLSENVDYLVDWENQTLTPILGGAISSGNTINIAAYEMGGGNQLFRGNYTGPEAGGSLLVPVSAAEIFEIALFVNGNVVPGSTWEAYIDSVPWSFDSGFDRKTVVNHSGAYYRALQTVPPGILLSNTDYWQLFVPTTQTLVTLPTTYGAGDGISLTVMGYEDPQYSWSTAVTQYHTVTATDLFSNTITLDNSMQGTNVANIIVTVNGRRLQPPEGIEWIGDGTSTSFGLPQRGNYSQNVINPITDIQVWVDNVLQVQNFGSVVGDYGVTAYPGSNTPGRQVVFVTPPSDGAKILIAVSTLAQYSVSVGTPSTLIIVPLLNLGDNIVVTSWNDTSQQNALTLVFVGPTVTGISVVEPYDSTGFSYPDTTNDAPGSYDYSVGVAIPDNNFDLGRDEILAERLWVTLDGLRLYPGVDFTVQGQYLILGSGTIATTQVVAVTEFTQSVVPSAMAFRLFQDMQGIQSTFRITNATTTILAQDLSASADIAYLTDASRLSEPNLTAGFFGVAVIDGERILYRIRDTATNTISGLQRGTAGTGAAAHVSGAVVTDMGIGNRQPQEYQNYIESDTSIGDGSTTIFSAPSIVLESGDSAFETDSIEVYVGGHRARPGYTAGQFVTGQIYTIASIGNTNWYDIGLPSDVFPAPGVVFTATGPGTGTGVVGTSLASNYYRESGYDPLSIEFITAQDLPAPAAGVEVTILQRRGVTWYAPGTGTPSNGEPLQITNTVAARFLRGVA